MTDTNLPTTKTKTEHIVDVGKVVAAAMTILGLPSAAYAAWQAYGAWQAQQVQIGLDQAAATALAAEREAQIAELFDKISVSETQINAASVALATATDQMLQLASAQTELAERLDRVERDRGGDTSPVIEFATFGNAISDGQIGGSVVMQWTFVKLRDCGAPKLDLWFENGAQVVHRFENASILNAQGRGINLQADADRRQTVRYNAHIPEDDGVTVGRAFGWLNVTYPDQCPEVPPVQSPKVVFEILP